MNSPLIFLNTANYVIKVDTTPFAVTGRVHSSRSFNSIFPVFLFLLKCVIVTTTLDPEATKSIAPPIPRIITPGTIQLAISHLELHCKAPKTVMSRCPPLMIPKEVDELKNEAPGKVVIGY